MTFSTLASPGVSLQGGSGSGGGTPGGSTTQIQYNNAGAFAGASGLTTDGTNLTLGSASQLLWSTDLILTRRGAANLRLGAADAAAPVAQTLSVQSVVTGTSNTAGANLTITGSQGTGTGAGGSIVFQVAPAGLSGPAQNALATFLEATSARAFNLYNTTDVTTNFERGKIAWESNVLRIGTEKGGTGTARALEFQTDGVTRINISAANRIAFFNSTASGLNSVCLGVSGTASGQDSSVLGTQNTASASQALVASYASSASATWASVFGGVANYATSTGSCLIGGYSGKTISRGQLTTGFKTFANDGDAQYSQFGFRGTTSDATQTEIFLWGDASNRATIPANTTWLFTVFVTAITQNGASNSGFVRRGMIKRDGSNNTSIVGTVQTIGTDIGSNSGSPPAGWDVSLTADDTNEALALKVTGAAATNIRWVARIEALEVQFA